MNDVVTDLAEGILRVELNRPVKLNAMTASMYDRLAAIFRDAARDEHIRVVLWHGAGDSFCAGNDIEDFLANPPGPGESAQARMMNALLDFDKPLVAAVRGAAIGGGTTMLFHCDLVYAGESTKFQMPFTSLALVPEFGSTWLAPITFGPARAAELILLGRPFDARRAAELGLVTQVVPDQDSLPAATEAARILAGKPAGALQATKRLLKRSFRDQVRAAMTAENEAFSVQVRSEEATEALSAFLERRPPHVTGTGHTTPIP